MLNVKVSSLFLFIRWLSHALGNVLEQVSVSRGSPVLWVHFFWLPLVLNFLCLHTNCQFRLLSDLCVVDTPQRASRFEVVYQLVSLRFSRRIALKFQVGCSGVVPSSTFLFKAANWYEREAFDLFGVLFSGHPDLRRLLTDYGFDGHPLRKDFPLSGFSELRYDSSKKQIISEPLEFSQYFRTFIFINAKQRTSPAFFTYEKASFLCSVGQSRLISRF